MPPIEPSYDDFLEIISISGYYLVETNVPKESFTRKLF